MKTTLEERLAAASANMKLTARKAFKHPITSILSLCVVAGIAATIASFSQTSDPAAAVTPATLPVAHTLTSKDGRTIDVTILSKSDTAIKAARADGKEFEIALDKLSDADKAFIAGLAAPDPKTVKKLTVLLMGLENPEALVEQATWLKNHGFDVTVGVMYDPSSGNSIDLLKKYAGEKAPNEKLEVMNPVEIGDKYDILWVNQFTDKGLGYEKGPDGKTIKGPSFPEMLNRRNKINKLVVIKVGNKTTARKKIYETNGEVNRVILVEDDFVGTEDNWIFYSNKLNSKGEEKLGKKISEKLIGLLK